MAVTFTAQQLQPILTKATCLYELSVYNGTGLEVRKNLVLAVDDLHHNTGCSDRGTAGTRAYTL